MVKRKAEALSGGEAPVTKKKALSNASAGKRVTEGRPAALTLEDLSSYDDFCSDLLIDKVHPVENVL